ncbi:beta-glucosidase [Arcticibacter pallidicorallinus]|uniref:Periplasmic beta-glucosidase n=1 Tax=Arcticibacter pallidicorallinus TaxID=1259464 RepID=A0A2T0U4Z8_9SPHI|nr:glycoside hydrolase family 3 N-terminal domain-containing protein [Arcticibacter pallidicorallinus]PRY52996.1 beta-glucosidase [Arcticibacter pallidicorallinus]
MKFISTKMLKRSCIYRATVLIAFSGTLTTYAQDRKIDWRVDSLMKLMTLEEKVGQLNQYSGREVTGPVSEKKTDLLQDIRTGRVGSMLNVRGVKDTREIQKVALESRLKIPLLFSLDVIHGYKTVFPIPLGEAASWDLGAMRLSAQIAAKEAAAAGIHWTFAPMVDVARDPRWGRVMEGAGEDAYLGSLIAEARVKGFQGEQLGSVESIMACAKHFAGYGASIAGRDYNAVDMSKQQLWETYLPPFKASVDAGVATFMNAFNTLNGVPATGNAYLQRDILKGKWNFKGFMVSDWGSIGEMIPWGYAANEADAAAKAITAGSDMDMESRAYIDNLAQLVKEGKVSLKWVDDAVRRILYKKFELGLFEDPYRFSNFKREKKVFSDPAHRVAARELAKKSIVLLKNDQNILPIKKDVRNIALIGPLVQAKRDLEGSWIVESDSVNVVSLMEGVRNQTSNKANLIYAKGAGVSSSSQDGFAAAVDAARKADVVIMALGETWDMSGEAKSRTDIHIPGRQEALFEAVKATGKPVIVVLMAGRPLIFDKIAAQASAILYAWWPGTEGGNAIADILFGAYNPSAKLPVTFPRSVGQIPLSYDVYNTGRPVKDPANTRYKSMYIDSPNSPMYAFGHGLSYTTFAYSDLKLDSSSINQNGEAVLSFRLTNTGKVTGEEVVQLYIHDEVASIARPLKQLKGFQKLSLKPGESRELKFTIKSELLSFYDNDLNWIAEPGKFKLMVGSASDDIRLQTNLTLR